MLELSEQDMMTVRAALAYYEAAVKFGSVHPSRHPDVAKIFRRCPVPTLEQVHELAINWPAVPVRDVALKLQMIRPEAVKYAQLKGRGVLVKGDVPLLSETDVDFLAACVKQEHDNDPRRRD